MAILDFIFPKNCLGCSREGKYICSNCVARVPVLRSVCPYCEKPSIDGLTHTKCKKKFGIDGLTSIWDYEGVIRKAILALKFKYSTEVGKELSDIFASFLKSTKYLLPTNTTLIPIPIHWHRENVRGFNQSEIIGKLVAQEMGWEFVPDLLVKKKSTTSQVELSVEGRKKNLQGVFSLNHGYSSTGLQNSPSVVIFDDVFTTGSTLKEAAKVLKRAGVEKVWGMTIAR